MTKCKLLSILALVVFASCAEEKGQKVVSLTDSSLSSIFERLTEKSNPFEFYKDVYENFRFELKSTLITPTQQQETAPVESVAIFESNENDESRFYKKSLNPSLKLNGSEKKTKTSFDMTTPRISSELPTIQNSKNGKKGCFPTFN
ncbi:MAG: hypothetical protein R2877_01590 [Bdellovibrionota bacterium]